MRQRRPKARPVESREPEEDEGGEVGGAIKWKYVAILVLLFGTTMIPVLGSVFSAISPLAGAGVSRATSALGSQLGLVATPRARLEKFYAKHNPEKVSEVPQLVAKYRGEYRVMIKRLEAKYNDYGFFIGWERDDDFSTLASKRMWRYYRLVRHYYRKHVPIKLRITLWRMYSTLDTALRPIVLRIRALLLSLYS